jgi:hypothetical protein
VDEHQSELRLRKSSLARRLYGVPIDWVILALALILRVAWAIAVPVNPVSDSFAYDTFARNLATGVGYGWGPGHLTALWPVGTSFVYSLLYRVFGFTYVPIVCLNLAFSLATIWLAIRLAERWFTRESAIACGLVLALWPTLIQFTSVLASELIFNFLLLAWLFVWDRWPLKATPRGLLLGVIAAATCYIRPTALLLPALLCCVEWVRKREFLSPLITTVLTYLVMAALIAPWSIRNTRLFGQFVVISTNGGVNLWEGNNPQTTGESQDFPPSAIAMEEGVRDTYLGGLAKDYIRQFPVRFAFRTLFKAVRLYSHETIGVYWNLPSLKARYGQTTVVVLKTIDNVYWYAVLFGGLAGVVILSMKNGFQQTLVCPAVALWIYFTAVIAVIVVQDRYHFPAIPLIALLCGVTVSRAKAVYIRRKGLATSIGDPPIRSKMAVQNLTAALPIPSISVQA